MNRTWLPLSHLAVATVATSCIQSSVSQRELRMNSDLATLTIPGVNGGELGIDRVSLALSFNGNSKKTYSKESSDPSKPVSVSAPTGEYLVNLEYFAGKDRILSTSNCGDQTVKLNLLRKNSADVSGFPVTVCFEDQKPWDPNINLGNDKPDPNVLASNQKKLTSTFTSGINIAWINFARDVGTGAPNLAEIKRQLSQLAASGGTVARLWIHTDGTTTPEYQGDRVIGPGNHTIKDLTKILDIAQQQKVQIMVTLWSFDMIRSELKQKDPAKVAANRLIVTKPAYLRDYTERALAPIVYALKSHPALHSWDICNEPEGMTKAENWGNIPAVDQVELKDVQVFVNRIAGKIHRIAPNNLVTVGAVSFKYLNKNQAHGNIYTDQALIKAGGDPMGYLDYYQVHHYANKGKENSPFQNPASAFSLDKPIFVGEFDMKEYLDFELTSPRLTYAHLKKLGYNGALGWKDGSIQAMPLMLNAMAYMQNPAPTEDDPESCTHFGGGHGKPFFENETLYRKKFADLGSDAGEWCIVD